MRIHHLRAAMSCSMPARHVDVSAGGHWESQGNHDQHSRSPVPPMFRQLEKQFKLRKQARVTRSGPNGRVRHSGGMVTMPTDMTGLIDVHTCGERPPPGLSLTWVSWHAGSDSPCQDHHCTATSSNGKGAPGFGLITHQQWPHDGMYQLLQRLPDAGPGSCRCIAAFTCEDHPGLVLLRSALTPQQQLQLARAALEEYPEPPATTNLTISHGALPGIFTAARQGLRCAVVRAGAATRGGAATAGCSVTASSGADAMGGVRTADAPQALRAGAGDSRCSSPPAAPGHRAETTPAGDPPKVPSFSMAPPTRAFADAWGPDTPGTPGTPASKLLRKLRWAALGPHYDWTARTYAGTEVPHRPLPAQLRELGVALAGVARRVLAFQGQGFQQAAGAALGSEEEGRGVCDAGSTGGRASSEADGRARGPGDGALAGPGCPFVPDAALVNYYYEGDTLCGHRDDVERDLQQPLVSLSLGLPAVFLIGRADGVPSALLVASGDVVVLSGQARSCFHGVPRVFGGLPLPRELEEAAAAPSAEKDGSGSCCTTWTPYAEYLKSCRINISIRQVL